MCDQGGSSDLRMRNMWSGQGPAASLNCPAMAQTVKRLPAVWEIRVQPLGREDLLEKEMVTHSSTLARKIP